MKEIGTNRKGFLIIIVIILIISIGILVINKDMKEVEDKAKSKQHTEKEETSIVEVESQLVVDALFNTEDNKKEPISADTVSVKENSSMNNENTKQSEENLLVEKILSTAVGELGKGPDANGITVYGKWYQDNVDGTDSFASAAWCAMFLSWCANKSGVSKDAFGYYAECSYWKNNFYVKNNLWHDVSRYTPKRGDLLFFDNHNNDGVADHNGIVETVTATEVTVIEGNLNNKVSRATYSIKDSKILGYGTPKYSSNSTSSVNNVQKNNTVTNTTTPVVKTSGQTSTSSQADKIIEIAATQLGNGPDGSGCTKYGYWYSQNIDKSAYFASAPYCAMFVTWCANQAGISTDIITPYAYCGYGIQYFQNKGCYYTRSSGYVPKKGDVIFFGVDNHTGLVEYSKDGRVYTIEGNSTNSKVCRRNYSLSYTYINGYGSPKYK